jgi:hypothetical protein
MIPPITAPAQLATNHPTASPTGTMRMAGTRTPPDPREGDSLPFLIYRRSGGTPYG